MNGRYKELDELEQLAIVRLINTVASCRELLEHNRTAADIDRLTDNLFDRASLITRRNKMLATND